MSRRLRALSSSSTYDAPRRPSDFVVPESARYDAPWVRLALLSTHARYLAEAHDPSDRGRRSFLRRRARRALLEARSDRAPHLAADAPTSAGLFRRPR